MRKKDIEKIVGASSARMEKNASTRTRTEILQLTRLMLYQLSYRDQAQSPTRSSDILTILLLPSCSI